MGEKIRVLKVQLPDISIQYLIVQDHRDILEDLRVLKDEQSVGDKMIITVQEMTQDEFSAIRGFDGW